jgi:hypothetical protein
MYDIPSKGVRENVLQQSKRRLWDSVLSSYTNINFFDYFYFSGHCGKFVELRNLNPPFQLNQIHGEQAD